MQNQQNYCSYQDHTRDFSDDRSTNNRFNRGDHRQRQKQDNKQFSKNKRHINENLTNSLVKILSTYPTFTASLLQLLETNDFKPSEVRKLASEKNHIFVLKHEYISLDPALDICHDNSTFEGCSDMKMCSDLHICIDYINNSCMNDEDECLSGHRWKTDHNYTLLKHHGLNQLPIGALQNLFVSKIFKPKKDGLLFCLNYNKASCNDNECDDLHLCVNFISGKCNGKKDGCRLKHSFISEKNKLLKFGIPVNETPMDIKKSLLELTSIDNQLKSLNASKTTKKEKKKLKKEIKEEYIDSYSDSSQDKSVSSSDMKLLFESDNEDENTRSVMPKAKAFLKKVQQVVEKPKTVWSHELYGNVTIPEICYKSVEELCDQEDNSCQRLHAIRHFHWQVQDSKKNWLNLSDEHVLALEENFCDVYETKAKPPALDPSEVKRSQKGLLLLLGRLKWTADFNKMELTHSDKPDRLKIRRLCTETVNVPLVEPSTMLWYFHDKNAKWVKYGNVDTTGQENLVSSKTSDDLEIDFKRDPTQTINFKNAEFNYDLDFTVMKQKNLKTNVMRDVRRRPMVHLKKKSKTTAHNEFPDTWDPMQPTDRKLLVTLAHSSDEYKAVETLIQNKGANFNILKVERVQNPYLWKALENKIQEMALILKDMNSVNVQQLFHGTNPSVVQNICDENFDWRLHGTNVGQVYGRGTYFSPYPKTADSYARADSSNQKYMFIAKVAIGSVILGNSGMPRPPINPQTNVPFDSTVDNVANPNIIVKYDKQEYYPQYVLTYNP